MKCRCAVCLDWIAWSRVAQRWYHLATGVPECKYRETVAAPSIYQPAVPLLPSDHALIRP
jgi:hypothetical protein